MDDIAAEVGSSPTLNRLARDHGIPVRTRGTGTYVRHALCDLPAELWPQVSDEICAIAGVRTA